MARFTEGELAVMQLLWKHGEMKPADIQSRFPREIKNPALRSHLSILLAKGHVTRSKVGKAFFYKAVTPEQNAFHSTLRDFLNNYCGGSVRSLLLNLIETEQLSSDELVELEKIAKANQSDPPKSKKRKSL
jgi:BlaI family transcriptional regulator, penicillinase repressor